MVIVHIITRSDTIGGAQRHVIDHTARASTNGHTVYVLSSERGLFSDFICNSGGIYLENPYLYRDFSLLKEVKAFFYILKILKNLKPDIVCLHSVKAAFLGRLSCLILRQPCIFTAHGWSHINDSKGFKRSFYIFIEKILSVFTKKIICVSRSDLEFSKKILKISHDKLDLVYNGVFLKKSLRNQNFSPNFDTLKFLTVARFQAPKDFFTLFKALEKVRHLNWQIDIVGDGPDEAIIKKLAYDSLVFDKCNFLGFVQEPAQLYINSDFFLLVSRSEGLPMSILEAMSFKLPIIASDVGGVSELVINNKNGFLIPKSDYDYLSEVLIKVLKMDKLNYKLMSDASFELFCSSFNFEQSYHKTHAIYEEVVSSV